MQDIRQTEPTSPGILTTYLEWMRRENPSGSESLEADIAMTFGTESGLRVLKLLEKAVLNSPVPLGASDSALREINAARHIVNELRRYASNGR
jgi:hypothetical protein